ncbi:hypothetical protein Hanom_Chr14g01285081 [Helianthus anomalus]
MEFIIQPLNMLIHHLLSNFPLNILTHNMIFNIINISISLLLSYHQKPTS